MVERSDDDVQLALDDVHAMLETRFTRMVCCSNDIDVKSLDSLGERSNIVAEASLGCVKGVAFLDTDEEGVFGPVGLLEFLRDLSVCKKQTTGIERGLKP